MPAVPLRVLDFVIEE